MFKGYLNDIGNVDFNNGIRDMLMFGSRYDLFRFCILFKLVF